MSGGLWFGDKAEKQVEARLHFILWAENRESVEILEQENTFQRKVPLATVLRQDRMRVEMKSAAMVMQRRGLIQGRCLRRMDEIW